MNKIDEARDTMIDEQLAKRGIIDDRLLQSMRKVPREDFVPMEYKHLAYWDGPLSIGSGQTISQPYIVALMIEALNLQSTDRVLEVGTGSGYNAAVMSKLAKEVHTVEIIYELFLIAEKKLKPYENVKVYYGDGYHGLHEQSPFEKIILTAAPAEFPEQLWPQLAEGGVMVAPVGSHRGRQKLYRYSKVNGERVVNYLCDVVFVPMISDDGGDVQQTFVEKNG